MTRIGVVVVAMLVLAGGCHSWRAHGPAAEAVLGARPEDRARLTLTDGSVLVLRDPRIRADSVVGTIVDRGVATRIAVPVSRIRIVETKEIDFWRTAGATAAGVTALSLAAIVALIMILVTAAGG